MRPAEAPVLDDEAAAKARKPGLAGRSPRRRGRGRDTGLPGEPSVEWRDRDLIEREERLKAASGRGIHARRAHEGRPGGPRPTATERKRKVQVSEPIIMREFCAATGLSFQQVAGK